MTVTCRSNLAGRIQERLTMEEVARRYGYEPGRSGEGGARRYGYDPGRSGGLRCAFHQGDRTASLRVYPGYGGWHCFGCGNGGSGIDFVIVLYGIIFY